MPAPRKFTEAQLHEAALAIVDREGLPALTMRRLAEALGTGAMTLYNYVEGRDGLEALLVGAVMAEMVPPATTGDDWSDDVCAIATAMWQAVRRHPNVIPLILNRRTDDVATLQAVEGPARGPGAQRSRGFRTAGGVPARVGLRHRLRSVGGHRPAGPDTGRNGAGAAGTHRGADPGAARPAGGDRRGRRAGQSRAGVPGRARDRDRRPEASCPG